MEKFKEGDEVKIVGYSHSKWCGGGKKNTVGKIGKIELVDHYSGPASIYGEYVYCVKFNGSVNNVFYNESDLELVHSAVSAKASKPYITRTVYSDGVEIDNDKNVTIDGETKTVSEWRTYYKLISSALKRVA